MLRRTLVIALIALIVSACCSSREATREVSSLRIQDSRDSVKVEKVVVAVHDTIMETTTIVVDRNETGDTLKLSTVTERDRVRDRALPRPIPVYLFRHRMIGVYVISESKMYLCH